MDGIFLLLGTNLGDRSQNLALALQRITAFASVLRSSSVYRTEAWGKTDQPEFYNQVVEIATPLTATDLLEKILEAEQSIGRIRLERWGERIIDIDILLYGEEVIDIAGLTIPHPQMARRRFTLIPLAELASETKHPVSGKTIGELLRDCDDSLMVWKVE